MGTQVEISKIYAPVAEFVCDLILDKNEETLSSNLLFLLEKKRGVIPINYFQWGVIQTIPRFTLEQKISHLLIKLSEIDLSEKIVDASKVISALDKLGKTLNVRIQFTDDAGHEIWVGDSKLNTPVCCLTYQNDEWRYRKQTSAELQSLISHGIFGTPRTVAIDFTPSQAQTDLDEKDLGEKDSSELLSNTGLC